MAVQKSRVTRSRRGMRRAHSSLAKPALTIDNVTGETHRRHHVSPEGYYKGRQVVDLNPVIDEEDEEDESTG